MEVQQSGFEALEIEPGDFIYADPPYDVEFTTYSAGGFSWDDQVRTAKLLAAHRWTSGDFEPGDATDHRVV